MDIKNNILFFEQEAAKKNCRVIAVSKTQPVEKMTLAYDAGHRLFGENKVQEMIGKQGVLPTDIEWHMIGHLQTNKVKNIAPFVTLIHAVDSLRLIEEINAQGKKNNRIIPCLLQVHIAKEETKFGFDQSGLLDTLANPSLGSLSHVTIKGLMGIASLTDATEEIRSEFRGLKKLFDTLSQRSFGPLLEMKELSMGMSSDYQIALEEGSTLIRVGSAIFGGRT